MLGKNVLAALTFAMFAAATPVMEAEKRNPPTCGSGTTLKCCNSVNQQLFNLIPVNVGVGCIDIISKSTLWGRNVEGVTQVSYTDVY